MGSAVSISFVSNRGVGLERNDECWDVEAGGELPALATGSSGQRVAANASPPC